MINNPPQIVVQATEPLTATAAHGLAQENLSPTPKPVQISPSPIAVTPNIKWGGASAGAGETDFNQL